MQLPSFIQIHKGQYFFCVDLTRNDPVYNQLKHVAMDKKLLGPEVVSVTDCSLSEVLHQGSETQQLIKLIPVSSLYCFSAI